jgi:hypothetical protein
MNLLINYDGHIITIHPLNATIKAKQSQIKLLNIIFDIITILCCHNSKSRQKNFSRQLVISSIEQKQQENNLHLSLPLLLPRPQPDALQESHRPLESRQYLG